MNKENLIEENEILKAGYIEIQNKVAAMNGYYGKQLEALYYSKIGIHELEIEQLKLQCKAIKRKIELAQQAINDNIEPDFNTIEQTVEDLLIEAQMELDIQSFQIINSKHYLTNLRSPGDYKDLNKLFKNIAKHLHPDVNPDLSVEQLELWHQVLNAYKSKDYDRIKAMEIVYEKTIYQNNIEDLSEDELILRNNVLKEGIQLLEEEYAKLSNSFPFTIKKNINDPDWLDKKINVLNEEKTKWQAHYEEKLKLYNTIKSVFE